MLPERLAEELDDFRALPCIFGRIVQPGKRDDNLRRAFTFVAQAVKFGSFQQTVLAFTRVRASRFVGNSVFHCLLITRAPYGTP